MFEKHMKIVVTFERRDDGGLRVWSDDVPELVLSHARYDDVITDVKTAIEVILSHRFGQQVEVMPLVGIKEALEDHGVVGPRQFVNGKREFVAYPH